MLVRNDLVQVIYQTLNKVQERRNRYQEELWKLRHHQKHSNAINEGIEHTINEKMQPSWTRQEHKIGLKEQVK